MILSTDNAHDSSYNVDRESVAGRFLTYGPLWSWLAAALAVLPIRCSAVRLSFVGLIGITGLVFASSSMATTWYVRDDGGTAAQCNGLSDTAYSGGQNQACALKHPFYLLPPSGNPLMVGGDTMIIGSGQYRMGLGADGDSSCNAAAPWNCTLAPIPSGTTSNPTRIYGKRGASGVCSNPPELWGTERARTLLTIDNAQNIHIDCLELTDRSNCIDGGVSRICRRDQAPYGNWAQSGLRLVDATNVELTDLNIHGFANTGVRGGRLRDVSFRRVRINGNAWSGLDWDLSPESSSNAGTILFDRVEIGYNGCAEGYPDVDDDLCWAQIEGGYGDGFGSDTTGGRFIIRDSYVHHNTSDGFDFLYADNTASLEVERSRFVANAGNQLKVSGNARIDSSEFIGECAYFEGRSFMRADDNCRARGNALSLNFFRGSNISVSNSTVTSEGDCIFVSSCRDDSCNGSESIAISNNILFGQIDWYQPSQQSCLLYAIDQPSLQPAYDSNIVYNVKNSACPGGNNICTDPLLQNDQISTFDARLRADSPAIDGANGSFATALDVRGRSRPIGAGYDIGANEFGSDNQIFVEFRQASVDVREGAATASIRVQLSAPANRQVSVWIATRAATATPGLDFYGFGKRIDFSPGQTFRDIDLEILDDNEVESREQFTVRLYRPVGVTLGRSLASVNILDDDTGGQRDPVISTLASSFDESIGIAEVVLQLSQPASVATRISVSTQPGSARNGADFYGFYRIVEFAVGITSVSLPVEILNDSAIEANESFSVNLFNADGLIIGTARQQIQIIDDD